MTDHNAGGLAVGDRDENEMGLLIHSINLTADGCCDHTEAIADDELHCYATDLVTQSDGLLFGRVTYELFERHWPLVARSGPGPTWRDST